MLIIPHNKEKTMETFYIILIAFVLTAICPLLLFVVLTIALLFALDIIVKSR